MPTSPPSSLSAAVKPRIESVPAYEHTDGDVAADFAAVAGLFLDGWQRDALYACMSFRADGFLACPEYVEIVSRQNGKGSFLEARVLAGFLLFGEKLIMWSAHLYKTSKAAFRRLRTLFFALGRRINDNLVEIDGILVKVNNTHGEEGFERRDTGQQIIFVARSSGGGRGLTGDLVIIDEAFAYTDDQHAALYPTMSARSMVAPGPQIIYTSSPPLAEPDSNFAAGGDVLFRLRKRGLAGDTDGLGYRDWGVDAQLDKLDRIDVSDRVLWYEANPALGVRIAESFVAKELKSLGSRKFAIERLGVWPVERPENGGAINVAHWNALADVDSRREGAVALGIDITPAQDYAAIVLYGHRTDGLGHAQMLDYRPGTEWIVGRLKELRDALNPMAICAARGTYTTLRAGLDEADFRLPKSGDVPANGDVVTVTGTDMTAAAGQILEAVRQASFKHVPEREFDAAICGAVTRQTSDSIAWSRKEASADITPLVAFTLAKWIYEARAPILNYDVLQSFY